MERSSPANSAIPTRLTSGDRANPFLPNFPGVLIGNAAHKAMALLVKFQPALAHKIWMEELQTYATIESLFYNHGKLSAEEWTAVVNDRVKEPASSLGASLAALEKREQLPAVITALTRESSRSIIKQKTDALNISCALMQSDKQLSKCLVIEGLLAYGQEGMGAEKWTAVVSDRQSESESPLGESLADFKKSGELPAIIDALTTESFASLREKNLIAFTDFVVTTWSEKKLVNIFQ